MTALIVWQYILKNIFTLEISDLKVESYQDNIRYIILDSSETWNCCYNFHLNPWCSLQYSEYLTK